VLLLGGGRVTYEPVSFTKIPVWIRSVRQNHRIMRAMFAILDALRMFVADLFKSRTQLEAHCAAVAEATLPV
jgi:hypothetical protein